MSRRDLSIASRSYSRGGNHNSRTNDRVKKHVSSGCHRESLCLARSARTAIFSTEPGMAFVGDVGNGKSARQDKFISEAFWPAPYDRRASVFVSMRGHHCPCCKFSHFDWRIVIFPFDPATRFVETSRRLETD